MPDYHHLVQRLPGEYHRQPSLIEIFVDGHSACGHRNRVDEENSASRIMILRGLLRHHNLGIGELLIDGRDVVEVIHRPFTMIFNSVVMLLVATLAVL